MEAWREELYHHGIGGQKWGVRNGPPYPLKESAKSSAEKHGSAVAAFAIAFAPEILVLSTMAVDASVRAANGIKNKKEANARKKAPIDKKSGLPLKTEERTEKEDARSTNPDYHVGKRGSTQNCVHCTVAFELRRRGFDVTAVNSMEGCNGVKTTSELFKGAKFKSILSDSYVKENMYRLETAAYDGKNKKIADDTYTALKNEPPGSRGSLMVSWNRYSGHAISYSVDKDHNVTIIDPQDGRIYNEKKGKALLARTMYVQYARLDNKQVDYKKVKRSVNT